MTLQLDRDEVMEFIAQVFPQVRDDFELLELGPNRALVRLNVADRHLRPGGTVSGPSLFGLADCGFYMLLLAHIGRVALTVTTNCSIDFMRKPAPGPVLAEVRMLKLGRTLAMGDVLMRSEAENEAVARASLTYAIPPGKSVLKDGVK